MHNVAVKHVEQGYTQAEQTGVYLVVFVMLLLKVPEGHVETHVELTRYRTGSELPGVHSEQLELLEVHSAQEDEQAEQVNDPLFEKVPTGQAE